MKRTWLWSTIPVCLLLACCGRPGPAPQVPATAPPPEAVDREASLTRELDARPTPERRARILVELGGIHLERGLETSADRTREHDLRRAVELFETLIRDYPDHAAVDHALYGIGYALTETDYAEDALIPWRALVCANRFLYPGGLAERAWGPAPHAVAPLRIEAQADAHTPESVYDGCEAIEGSSLVGEVWLRIGEVHFEGLDGPALPMAASAYRLAVLHGEPRIRVLARYKLGWTCYRRDRFAEAIGAFVGLLSDESSGQEPALRDEATQYIAISLSEDDWDLDGEADAGSPPGLARIRAGDLIPADSPWLAAILETLAQIYADLTRYRDAVATLLEHGRRFPDRCLAPVSVRFVRRATVEIPEAEREALASRVCGTAP